MLMIPPIPLRPAKPQSTPKDAPSTSVAPSAEAGDAYRAERIEDAPALESAPPAEDGLIRPDAAEDEDSGVEEPAIDPADVARVKALFSRFAEEPQPEDGSTAASETAAPFRFARWDRGLSPRVFGVDEGSETAILYGVSEAARLAGVEIVEEDPEFEANLLIFVCEEWRDLKKTPGLDRLIPDLDKLVVLLGATGANQYRIFSFSEEAGLRLAVVLVRCDEVIGRMSARALGLSQAAQTLLLWSDAAFADEGPVATSRRGEARIKPWICDLLAASYEDGVPVYSEDVALLERLAASAAARRRKAKAASASRKSDEYERRTAQTAAPEKAAEEDMPPPETPPAEAASSVDDAPEPVEAIAVEEAAAVESDTVSEIDCAGGEDG